ncbi:MAG: hypothetical protein JWO41_243 [Candidatus Saccharibacteria bacterium]|nr:hypothetical protein [Candidatus Saccharibacteria bacterium]
MLQDFFLFLVGIVVGGMNAIAGGGIILGFPALLAAGLSPLAANMTSNIVILPGQISSIFGYRKYLAKVPNRYLFLVIPCFIGGIIGALILRYTTPHSFEQLVPGLVLLAVVLFAFQPLLHFQLHSHIKKTKARKQAQPMFALGLAILPMAIYGGYFGAGFGFMMLAFLGFTSMHDTHQMSALKNLAGLVIAAVSIVCLFSTGQINWHLGGIMAAGNFIGGYVGARLAQRLSTHWTRISVIIIGLVTITYLAFRLK